MNSKNSGQGKAGRIYVFRGDSILLREDIPDDGLAHGIPPELFDELRDELRGAAGCPGIDIDTFEAPALDVPGTIRGALLGDAQALPPRWRTLPVRQGLSLICAGETINGTGPVGRLLRAYHVAQWRRESAYCGSCGTKNTEAPDELARLCPGCGRREYPRISPAVITIIINDNGDALLAHNRKFADGVYSLIAGFNEAGESLEATVSREIQEEVGLEVKDIRYIASQPWPFPNSLMLGFSARYAAGNIRPDGQEIVDARWFKPGALPKLPGSGSVSRYLINRWLAGNLDQ
ncbi:MAG: NAD(+) diphosphatase [Treponema sp.]|nr:NAD(+) diphosphatase [Treponema sp.]